MNNPSLKTFIFILISIFLFSCQENGETDLVIKNDQQLRVVSKSVIAPQLDGMADDPAWKNQPWYDIDQQWLGADYSASDFSGRYKLTWTPEGLYILAEIQDDTLVNRHRDPLKEFWQEDYLEIFIDENNTGGDHQYNQSAFAYHLALDGNVVDNSPDSIPRLYNNHISSEIKRTGTGLSTWELRVTVYDESYCDGLPNDPVVLRTGKKIGFALAYSDSDGEGTVKKLIGSIAIPGEDKNRAWIDSGLFGTLLLVE